MKLAAKLSSLLLLTGCSTATATAPTARFPEKDAVMAWPSLAACMDSLRRDPPGSGDPRRACVRIDFQNKLSRDFILRELTIGVDGTVLYAHQEGSDERGVFSEWPAFTVFLDRASPGTHQVQMIARLVGDPTVQPSLAGARWGLCSAFSFVSLPGGEMQLDEILYSRLDKNTPLAEAPSVRFLENGAPRQLEKGEGFSGPPLPGCSQPAPK